MRNPFFSIIIPTYNRADLITKAIFSTLNQTYQDFEIIVVDDGSKDETEEVVKNIDDKRIRYFKKENEERSIARNYGIDKANGEYICFLDADDYYLKNHLDTVYKFISSNNIAKIIHTGYEFRDENNKLLKQIKSLPENINETIIKDNPLICNSIIIKKDLLKTNKFINSKFAILAEDWYLWILLASFNKIYNLNTITTVVIEHSNRSLNQLDSYKIKKSFDLVIENLFLNKKVIEKYKKKNLNLFANNRYMFCSYTALSQKKYSLFLISLFMAFKYSPTKTISRLIKKLKGKS